MDGQGRGVKGSWGPLRARDRPCPTGRIIQLSGGKEIKAIYHVGAVTACGQQLAIGQQGDGVAVACRNHWTVGGPGGSLGGLNPGQTKRQRGQHQRQWTVVVFGFHMASCGISRHPRFTRSGLRSFGPLSPVCRETFIRDAHKPWSCPSLDAHASISRFQQTGQEQERSVEGGYRKQAIPMEFVWNSYGTRMELVWNLYGICMEQHAHNTPTAGGVLAGITVPAMRRRLPKGACLGGHSRN